MLKHRGWHCWGVWKHRYSHFCLILKNAAPPCPKAWDSVVALWGHLHSPSIGVPRTHAAPGATFPVLEKALFPTEMLTFPFLCFPLLFPFPERDRTVSHCPMCGHWPPLVPAVPQPCHSHGSMHSTPARPEERGGPCLARQVLSAQSCHSVGKLFDWKRCPRPLS